MAQAKKAAPKAATPAKTAPAPAKAEAAPAAFVPGKTTLVEKVTAQPGKIVIPYEKYRLSNGLTVIVHEDHSDPLIHVDVTYHVGSSREELGKSGFAHFFEHMMFQGSEHVADEEHIKTITAAGGEMNGTTSFDRTNYFETLPKNQLETAMWLESDRMGWLLNAVTQEKFEIQRATVKNERGQSYDNRPYGRVPEVMAEAMYPYGHPYSWMPIGFIEDLNRVDVNDLKRFFLRWYGPQNAVLTVGGDVTPSEVVALAEKYFGTIPPGKAVSDMPRLSQKFDKDRYVSYEDNVRFPLMVMDWPTVPQGDKDEAALDALAEILGGGSNSLLYQALDKKELALQSGAGHPCQELAGTFQIQVVAYPGKTLGEMEKIVRQVLVDFEKRGVTDEDLSRFKAGFEAQTIASLSEVSGKVGQLALYETYTKNPNQIQNDLDRRLKVTKEDIMRVYNEYIKGKGAVILSCVPKGESKLIAAANNFTVDKSKYVAPKVDEYKGLTYTRPNPVFDRSKKPVPAAAPTVSVPDFWTKNFDNGMKIIGTQNSELPVYAIRISLRGGHRLSALDPKKAGIASFTAGLMNEGTQNYTKEQFETQEALLGTSISVSSSGSETTIYMSGLKKNLDKALALLEERIMRPKFTTEDFERDKKQTLEGIKNQVTQPTVIASQVYAKLLYGKDNILAVPTSGTEETVSTFTLGDVKEFYNKYYNPAHAEVVIVGDVTQDEILPKIKFLETWKKKDYTIPVVNAKANQDKTTIYLIDKTNAPQSEVRIGYIALPYDATGEYFKSSIMNFPLGRAFNSRINLKLREEKGWTYGARSGFSGSDIAGTFTASAGVKATASDSSVFEFMNLIKGYRDGGITDEELEFTKRSLSQSDALEYETIEQKAGFLNMIQRYNLPKDFTKQQADILSKITKDEINALAKRNLPAEKMAIIVVGDKKEIYEGLKGLGYPIIELDAKGEPVKAGGAPAQNKKPWESMPKK